MALAIGGAAGPAALAQAPAAAPPHAFVFCKVGITKTASRCEAVGEAPAGQGLGAAAVKAVEGTKAAAPREASVGGGALIPVCFDLSGPAASVKGTGEGCPVAPAAYTAADLLAAPSESQIKKAYPARAAEAGISGRATLRCVVDSAGKPRNCDVSAVSPPGESFDTTALSLAELFLLRPKLVDGSGRAGVLTLSLRFDPNGLR